MNDFLLRLIDPQQRQHLIQADEAGLPQNGQEQLAQILENCELWIFDPDTAKVFANAIERLFYSDSFRIGKAVLPRTNVRSRLWDLDGIILQSVQSKLAANQRDVKNSTAPRSGPAGPCIADGAARPRHE